MTVYRQNANPNATNSELDAKVIVKHPRLTHTQRDELIGQFVEIQVDSMDTQTLVEYVTDMLVNDYSNFNDYEIKERVDCYDEDLYNELVENIQITDLMKEKV